MVRKKVDVGIDLGTTNSCAAVIVNGTPEIIPNAMTNAYLTPSCVAVSSRGEIEVGMAANNVLVLDKENAAEGFKRYIGTNNQWGFPNSGAEYDSEQLSGLLLSSIRRDVETYLNKDVESAVITIPAVFGERERSATLSAAKAAGFNYAELVQEPIAAGLSYGWANSDDTRPFLVYDIGGGTFDAAILHTENGLLAVRAANGDHALGGRDIDREILNEIVIPQLDSKIDVRHLHENKKLMMLIEEAKIRVSRLDETILSFEGSVSGVDEQIVTSPVVISRSAIAAIVEPIAERSFEVIDELLLETGLRASELKGILLVGGPTRMPSLREFLEKKFGAPLETRIDPMTVVARGAALHAASIMYEPNVKNVVTPGVQNLRIEYSSVSDQLVVPVGIAGEGERLSDGCMFQITRTDGLWQTGQIPVQNGRIITEVSIAQSSESNFKIELLSPEGNKLPVDPAEFSILSGLSAAAPPISKNIGVSVATPLGRPKFEPMVRRGESLPISATQHFFTMKSVQAGEKDVALQVYFLEGFSDRPQRCGTVGVIELTGADIEMPLPAGSEVIVTLKISADETAQAVVQIPLLGITLEKVFQITYSPVPTSTELKQRIALEEQVADRLEGSGIVLPSTTKAMTNQIVEDIAEAENGDNESAIRAGHALSRLGEILEEVEHRSESQLAFADMLAIEEFASQIVESYGDEKHKETLISLKAQGQSAQQSKDIPLAHKVEKEMTDLGVSIYWDQPGAWMAKFKSLVEDSHFVDPVKAAALIEEGSTALEAGDSTLLKSIIIELWNLDEESHREGPEANLMWLRRA